MGKNKLPSVDYLESLYSVLSNVHNGRYVHERDNIRQSLYFFIQILNREQRLNASLRLRLGETVVQAKNFIKKVWEAEWKSKT